MRPISLAYHPRSCSSFGVVRRVGQRSMPNRRVEADREPHPIMWTPRPNAECFSSEIGSCRFAVEVDRYLTGISPSQSTLYCPSWRSVS